MIKSQFRNFILVFLFLFSEKIYSKSDKEMESFLKQNQIGNFKFPYSQQPGPLVGFGENILKQNRIQTWVDWVSYFGESNYTLFLEANILYGITDFCSILVNVPVSPSSREGTQYSSGLGDILGQFEWAYASFGSSDTYNQATLVGNVSIPSGSILRTPPTGFGATSFFLGATFNHTEVNWFLFYATGVELTTNLNGTKSGNEILYQFGFGRNIPSPRNWIFAWLVEGDGTYSGKNKIKGRKDDASGGNVVYVTPSLFAASQTTIFQLGVGYPVIQSLNGFQYQDFNGSQYKEFLSLLGSFVYTF